MKKTLGNKLNNLMIVKKLTGKQLASDTGITEGTISKILTGINTNPKSDTVITLAKYFGVTSDYLLGLSDAATVEHASGISELTLKVFDLNKQKFEEDFIPKITEVMNDFIQDYAFTDICFAIAGFREKYGMATTQKLIAVYMDMFTHLKYLNSPVPTFSEWLKTTNIPIPDEIENYTAFVEKFCENIEKFKQLTGEDVSISYPVSKHSDEFEDVIDDLVGLALRLAEKYSHPEIEVPDFTRICRL